MRRREFITLLGGTVAWPIPARAQQPAMPVVGFLGSTSAVPHAPFVAAFQQGLKETGFIDGQNVRIEFRWAEGQYDQLLPLATDLARRQVTVIVAGGTPSALAAKTATKTIPIVFSSNTDPVKLGLVASLNRPGGNLTGLNQMGSDLTAKQLELLHELVPSAAVIALLVNPTNPISESVTQDVQEAARMLRRQIHVLSASTEREIDAAFASLSQLGVSALIVGADAFFLSRRDQLAALAIRHSMPAMFSRREFVHAGGLIAYATDLADSYRQMGIYSGKILKGEKPAEMPVQQLVKVELIINLKTAKTLGLDVPLPVLMRVNEVIEQ